MPIAGTQIELNPEEGMDKISETTKVTTPYHSDGSTELLGSSLVTSSLTDTNEKYYFGISNSTTPTVEEWNVTFGSTNGYGVSLESNTKSETAAIYGQYANLLLAPTEVTGGFFISSKGSSGAVSSGKDSEIFVLTARRGNMKDRLNKGNWTLAFSGSASTNTGLMLELTDDSIGSSPTATPAGDRYNIVSGTLGTVVVAAATKTYGFFYPDQGIMVFSQQEMSASIPGAHADLNDITQFFTGSHAGFATPTTTNQDSKLPLKFINALHMSGAADTKMSFRDEEDQVSAQYFCRVRSAHCNFSNNPTFISGSQNKLRHDKMRDNPQTFITSVQLYNTEGHMVAVGNLSTPLRKNYSTEATIKVKLTY